jgi:transcriptional regulator with PAS, ATPase and Fis domain
MADRAEPRAGGEPFRWQALFQGSREPVFVLNRRGRLWFVNRAWEDLAGIPHTQARGLRCKRSKTVEGDFLFSLASVLAPPPGVLQGESARVRRLVHPPQGPACWWDIEFLPLQGGEGLLAILGKIRPEPAEVGSPQAALPAKLIALGEVHAQRYRMEALASEVPAMQRAAEQVRLAGRTRANVLIVGEPGTGKHWLARTIHNQAGSPGGAFAGLDCAGLPPPVLAAALLGPGGLARRPGIGTVYLREISRLPRELQGQLCEWLAEAESARPRVIASLTTDPVDEVAKGRLLEELRCTLATLQLSLLPLRQRSADLPLLVPRMLEQLSQETRPVGLARESWEIIRSYSWPGNLRELHAVLAGALQRMTSDRIVPDDLPAYLRRAVQLEQTAGRSPERPLPLKQLLEQVERRLIQLALRMAKGKKSRAARILSIWRPLLLRRLDKLGLSTDGGSGKQ